MQKSGFFTARQLEDGTGYDREYSAADFAAFFAMLFKNGIRENTHLRVRSTGDGNHIQIDTGQAIINGYHYILTEPLILHLQTPPMPQRRVWCVVLRLDLRRDEGRKISVELVAGEDSIMTPTAPNITRNDEIFELGLADILLNSTTLTVTEGSITDLRLDSEFCGVITM